jgi:mitosis inhibitor protein kinase SWE1
MHLPSPTHHGYRMEGAHFSSIQQLRRSLSRSPSKPSRFQLRTSRTDTPGSPLSPLALARAFSPKVYKPTSPIAIQPESPFVAQAQPTTKKKFSLRRAGPFRSSPRNRTTKSPRRALGDSTDLGNSTPFVSRPLFGEENMPVRKSSLDFWDSSDNTHFDIDDKPIKFEFARSQNSNLNANCFNPPQASPLKRRETNTGFDSANNGTPNPKRRSLHAGLPSGAEMNLFDSPAPRPSAEMLSQVQDNDFAINFSSPNHMASTQSPRRTPAPRRTVSQRANATASRPKQNMDGDFAKPLFAASKSRQRMSLDGASLYPAATPETPFARPAPSQLHLRGGAGNPTRHPLANQMTVSPSMSNFGDESPQPAPYPSMATPRVPNFSKSLPIGASRPTQDNEESDAPPFATPFLEKKGLALPQAVPQSTGGLQSKKHRNVEELSTNFRVPDTPTKASDASKRNSYPPSAGCSPMPHRRSTMLFGVSTQSRPEFGTPSTPFGAHPPQVSNESIGKGASIFGSLGSAHQRRGSFLSFDGDGDVDLDVDVDDNSNSPIGKHMTDSQSSADDMPPTPTKHNDGSGRRSKESSLRRRTFRSRVSVDSSTFAAPDSRGIDIPAASALHNVSESGISPRTPNESIPILDASKLSISGNRRESMPFNSSFGSSFGSSSLQPPMTPTAIRDGTQFFTNAQTAVPTFGVTKNDVDPSLTERFHNVAPLHEGGGAFSDVFKVSRPLKQNSPHPSPPGSQFWVVKKSKKQFRGHLDRERQLREVKILQALRDSEYIVRYADHWEFNERLYIQTEYCEEGNLKTFLDKNGYHDRLDDFRIWKLLLDLSTVSSTSQGKRSGLIHNRHWILFTKRASSISISSQPTFLLTLVVTSRLQILDWPSNGPSPRLLTVKAIASISPLKPSTVNTINRLMSSPWA